MRPKKHRTVGSNDLFRARLDQIINLKHELVLLAHFADGEQRFHAMVSRHFARS